MTEAHWERLAELLVLAVLLAILGEFVLHVWFLTT